MGDCGSWSATRSRSRPPMLGHGQGHTASGADRRVRHDTGTPAERCRGGPHRPRLTSTTTRGSRGGAAGRQPAVPRFTAVLFRVFHAQFPIPPSQPSVSRPELSRSYDEFLEDIKARIRSAQARAARAIKSADLRAAFPARAGTPGCPSRPMTHLIYGYSPTTTPTQSGIYAKTSHDPQTLRNAPNKQPTTPPKPHLRRVSWSR